MVDLLRSPHFHRLFVPYLFLIVAGTIAMGLFASARLRATYVEGRQQALREQAWLVHALIAEDIQGGRLERIQDRTRNLGASTVCRITVVADDGRVMADTQADPAHMGNQRLRPEIVEAAARGEGVSLERSDTTRENLMYFARRTGEPGGPVHYVRLAVPLAELDRQLERLYLGLAVGGAFAVLAGGVVCYALAGRQASPLDELTRLAESFGRGDLSRRAPGEERGEIGVLARALNTMGESLASLMSQLAQEKDQLLTIIAGMNEGVIATDRHMNITLFNQAAASQWGFPADAPTGKPLWEYVAQERLLKSVTDVLASARPETFSLDSPRSRHLEISVYPLVSREVAQGLVIVSHDRTEAARYDELRKEFVANVSHELRTPITMIKGFVETLQEGAIRDPVKGPEFLGTIKKHVDQLANLVEDLLQLSALESRPGLPRSVAVDLGSTVRKVVELMRPASAKKAQALTAELAPGLPPVVGDPDYLERAISNLVDNAIKYTPEKGRIKVVAARAGAAVRVEVRDNGIGIPAEDLPRVFDRFYRVDKSRSREMGGTGLGLAIVKHVAQAHGGTVGAASELGKGSRFEIVIPAAGEAASANR